MEEQFVAPETLPPPTSFFTRFSNVFASPGELFAEVAVQPVQLSSWLIPLFLSILLMVGTTMLIFSNDSLRTQALEKQREAIQKMINEGKITQEQADKQLQMMEGSKLMLVFAGAAALGMSLIVFFAIPLIVWLAAMMMLKYHGGYFKIVEAYGLTVFVSFLGGIVTIMLMNIFQSIYASPGGWLLLAQSYDSKNSVHTLISAVNIFYLWQVALIGIGLSRLTGKPAGAGMGVAFGLWAVVVLVIVAIGAIFR